MANIYTMQDLRRVIGSRRLISRVLVLVIRASQRLGDECDSCRTVLCEQGLGCVRALDVVRDYVITFAQVGSCCWAFSTVGIGQCEGSG